MWMSLQTDHVGLSNGRARETWNVPQVQPSMERIARSGLAPAPSTHMPPSQPQIAGRGIIGAFVKICQRWHLAREDQIILLGYKGSAFFGEQLLDGNFLSPPQDALDRAGYVLAISVGLGSLFDDAENAELAWLNAVRSELDGSSPLAHMLKGRMANVIEVVFLVNRERGM
jgi:hypothetical protein